MLEYEADVSARAPPGRHARSSSCVPSFVVPFWLQRRALLRALALLAVHRHV